MPAAFTQTSSRPCSAAVALGERRDGRAVPHVDVRAGRRSPERRRRLAGCGLVEIGDDDGRPASASRAQQACRCRARRP